MAKYQVIKATQRPIKQVEAAGRVLPFGKAGGFEVSDAGIANEIEAKHGGPGGDVVVIPDLSNREHGHKYFFGQMPEMPWKKVKNVSC